MKICLFTLVSIFICLPYLNGQRPPETSIHQKGLKAPIIICHHNHEVGNAYVPALYSGEKIEKNSALTIIPTYNAEMPQAARTSIETIVIPILSNIFQSNIPIHIDFEWGDLGAGVIAQAIPANFLPNFVNYVPIFGAAYPLPLAEKIADQEINGAGEPDVIVQINSVNDYCFDCTTQGSVGMRFDFPTVMIHEIFHGLGFVSLIRQPEANSFDQFISDPNFGIVTFPYNFYLENASGERTLDLANRSPELTAHLTTNNLFFDLPSRARAKLFAPSPFQNGSSIAHLDFTTYAQTSSSLMTPSTNLGNFVRDGGVANDILKDIGWSFTAILHEPEDLQALEFPNDQPFTVNVDVKSDEGFNPNLLELHYSTDGFFEEDSLVIFDLVEGNHYSAQIPASGENIFVEYYISVQDMRGMPFTSPGKFLTGTQATYAYAFGPDAIPPVLSHVPVESVKTTDTGLELVANADDFFRGIDVVKVEWMLNGEVQPEVNLPYNDVEEFEGDRYEGVLPFPRTLVETDSIEYMITAIDSSSLKNSTSLPATGYYKVEVIPVVEAVATYDNDFNSPSDDFQGNNFSIATPTGFSNGAIHSVHPYPNAGQDKTLNFTYELKIPIVIEEGDGAFMQYDEVVLVEPGNPGVTFGRAEFWDYCIVEGKKFGQNTWQRFIDGYDSGDNSTWLSFYNNGVIPPDINSQRFGNSTMFMERRIDLLANGRFAAGDTVFVRFRLFSDPYAAGWGWAIDNLVIQDRTIAVEDYVREENFSIQPNPVIGGQTIIALDLENPTDQTVISVMDIYGRKIYSSSIDKRSQRIRHVLNLDGVPPGIYVVNVSFNDRDTISKKFVKQ